MMARAPPVDPLGSSQLGSAPTEKTRDLGGCRFAFGEICVIIPVIGPQETGGSKPK